MTNDRLSLPLCARELAKAHLPPPWNLYDRAYQAVLNGQIPATQHNGRWFVERADLPAIAAALGLVPAKPSKLKGSPAAG